MKRVASLDSKKSGFTLLELLIVLAILIVIIGILGTTVWNSYKRALIRAAEVKIKTLTQAVEEFKMDQREYPTLVEGLYILANVDNPDAAAAMQQAQMQQQTMGMAGQNNMNGMNGQMNTGMMNDPTMMNGQAGMMNDPMMNGQMNTGMMNGQMNNMTGMQQTATVNPMKPKRKIPEPYIKETDLEDPWNNPFKYEWPTTKGDGKKPAIWSMGPDGEDNNGDGDDIINWDATDMSGQMNAQQNAQAAGLQNGMMNNGMMNNGMMNNGMTPQGGMDMTGGMQGGMDMTGGMQGMQGGMDMTGGMQGGMQQGGMPQGGQQQPMF